MKTSSSINRRYFTKTTLLAGAALASGAASALAADEPTKRMRTGLIGCGSVSNQYLPQLTNCPFTEVVSLCDIKPERAKHQPSASKSRIIIQISRPCSRASHSTF